jgi:hypothetical protein
MVNIEIEKANKELSLGKGRTNLKKKENTKQGNT